jgi:excisionase family DNA binding protein
MLENASQVHVPAPEDSLERERIQNQRDFEPLLDTDEAARLLRMHPRTLRTKARRGSIPAVQVGNDGAFAPPRSIVGSENSPAKRRQVEEQKHLDRHA